MEWQLLSPMCGMPIHDGREHGKGGYSSSLTFFGNNEAMQFHGSCLSDERTVSDHDSLSVPMILTASQQPNCRSLPRKRQKFTLGDFAVPVPRGNGE